MVRLMLAAAALWLALSPGTAFAEPYSFAVVPQFDQRKLFAVWKPILDEVTRRTGIELRLIAPTSVSLFEMALEAGQYDFAYANPYHLIRASAHQGYIPMVRSEKPLAGVVVVPKGSPITTPQDLEGKLLAVPSLNAVVASLLVRSELALLHKIRVRTIDAKTHTSAYLYVVNGLAEAGGGAETTLAEQPAEVRAALRVVYRTREMPSHPISAHPRVPAAVREAVRGALLTMAQTPDGERLLAAVPMRHPVSAAGDDYRALAGWGLEEFWDNAGEAPR